MADFLRGNVLGGGNRCRGGKPTVTEGQSVVAVVPFDIYSTGTFGSLGEATTKALGMLNLVDLLNPQKTYPLTDWLDLSTVGQRPFHFCYPSEAAAFALATNFILVQPGPVYDLPGPILSTATSYFTNVFNFHVDVMGIPIALNAWTPFADAGWQRTGLLIMKKFALRHTETYVSRTDIIFDGVPQPYPYNTGNYTRRSPVPVNLPPGEDIFLPSDVPGLGSSSWSAISAPPLRPVANTADNATATADDMNQTADSQ